MLKWLSFQRIRTVVFFLFGITFSVYSQGNIYDVLNSQYNRLSQEEKFDSALCVAKEMNNWSFHKEGDTSLKYAVSFKFIGDSFDNLNHSDSSLYFWNRSLNLLNFQNRSETNNAAYCYYNIGIMYFNIGEYGLAEPYFIKASKIFEKISHSDYAKSLNSLGVLYYEIGNKKMSEFYYKHAANEFNKVFGEGHLDYANCLDNLGILYLEMGDIKLAQNCYKHAAEIYKKVLGEDHPEYATSLNDLGILYSDLSDFKSAEQYYKEALEIRKKIFGEEHPEYASILNNLGTLYEEIGDYNSAEYYFKNASEIFKKALGEKHNDYALSLNNLGLLYYKLGEYNTAASYYKRALDIFKNALGVENPDYAITLNNLSLLYSDMGDYQAAEPYYKDALEIFYKINGEESSNYAVGLTNIGLLYSNMGNFKAAEPYYQKASNIFKKSLGEEDPLYSNSLNNLGILYNDIGDFKRAEHFYIMSKEIYKKIYGENHPKYAISLNNLGALYQELGEFNVAKTHLKQAAEIYKNVLGKNHPNYAMSLNNLGVLYYEMSDFKTARHIYKQALKICKKSLGKEHPDYALNLNNLGDLSLKMKEYNSAYLFYTRSLEIRKKSLTPFHPDFASNLYNLGDLKSKMGDFICAQSFYNEAFSAKLNLIRANFSWLTANEKTLFWQQNKEFYEKINEFTFHINGVLGSTFLSYNSNLISKSLLLETSRELDHTISNSSDNLLKEQFSEMKQLRRLVSKMQSEGSDKKEIIKRYNQQADTLDKILVNKLGEDANAKRKFEITWKDVQAGLTSKEAAIEFARYYDYQDSTYKYMALVVRPGYEYPKLVKLGSEFNIKNASSQREFSDLYKFVWVGIDSLLTGVKTIYYSPVGELNNVSFSALMSEFQNPSDSSKSSWFYLIDRYDLHQVTTTRYIADGTLKRNDSLPLSIKLIGGVNYLDLPLTTDSVAINETTEDLALQINLQNEVIETKSNRGGKISYLKGSEIEVKEINNTLKNKGWLTTISSGKNANEHLFKKELNLKSPGIIHISTHGFSFPEKVNKEDFELQLNETTTYRISEDPMVRCGLMFSGANITWNGDSKKMIETTGDDGILTAAEVANLDLSNTKLVVLSACETGLGKIESSEGTFGLKRGFKLAGVDQIIVSLWKVPDNESMELMTLFYSELAKSNNIDSSFSKAQKVMRNRYPFEPEKWAGFVLVR